MVEETKNSIDDNESGTSSADSAVISKSEEKDQSLKEIPDSIDLDKITVHPEENKKENDATIEKLELDKITQQPQEHEKQIFEKPQISNEKTSHEQEKSENNLIKSDLADNEKDLSISALKVGEVREDEEDIDYSCCDPRQGYYRFVALFFMCFLSFGSYFCYDTPGSLQDQIKEDMGVNTVQFASLYSLYSWPNVILCFVGGFLIDRVFGVRLGAIIFSIITTVGQLVYSFGAMFNQFWLMQLGRFIFGIGGESLAVAQNTYTVAWFKGKELNTVFGLLLSMSRIGSTVNFLIMGPIYSAIDESGDKEGYMVLGLTLLVGVITCVFSLSCAFILGILDRRRVKYLKLGDANSGEKIQLKDVLTFPATFWLISIICVTYYVAIFPFIGLAKVFFMRKYGYQESKANGVSSLVYVISAVASPFFGFIVDKTGKNVMWVFIAILISLGCHLTLAFTFFNPFIVMIILGFGYSLLASSLWPMVGIILPQHQIATGYGIIQSIQNLGLALISLLGGLIVDSKGYFLLEMFYILWLCFALSSSVVMMGVDDARGGYLMMSTKRRREVDEMKKKLTNIKEE